MNANAAETYAAILPVRSDYAYAIAAGQSGWSLGAGDLWLPCSCCYLRYCARKAACRGARYLGVCGRSVGVIRRMLGAFRARTMIPALEMMSVEWLLRWGAFEYSQTVWDWKGLGLLSALQSVRYIARIALGVIIRWLSCVVLLWSPLDNN